jgi:hypothetical protein
MYCTSRFGVATREVRMGELLCVEHPSCFFLQPEHEGAQCTHCFRNSQHNLHRGKVNRHRNNEDLPPIHPSASTAIITTSFPRSYGLSVFLPVWVAQKLFALPMLLSREIGDAAIPRQQKARSSLLLVFMKQMNVDCLQEK